jgi:BarA-like signal transduction histidine kinase
VANLLHATPVSKLNRSSATEVNSYSYNLKVQMARQLREETTVNWKWIAERLKMGHWRSAANAVRLA